MRYKDRLQAARKKSQSSEALLGATGQINGFNVSAVAFEYEFMGGSMGSVVGERFVQTANYSLEHRQPLISFAASGWCANAGSTFFSNANVQDCGNHC